MIKNKIIIIVLTLFVGLNFLNCSTSNIETFGSKASLYFPKYVYTSDQYVRIDTAFTSFSFYPGIEEITVPFKISLVGKILNEDKEYKVVVVDSLTTAKVGQYAFDEKLTFRRKVVEDSLCVKIFKSKLAENEEVVLTLRLIENENFTLGYNDKRDIKLRFNNAISKPTWWDKSIEESFFGVYSYKKFQTIIEATAVSSIEGLAPSDIRILVLKTKDYIEDNNITEEDGSKMILTGY